MTGAPHNICHTSVNARSREASTPRKACLPLLLCLALQVGAQTPIITDTERREGERALHLNGLFSGADTVYMQVYHDGDLLHDTVCINTWQVALHTHDYYILKFTDRWQRTKRIHFVELSDDQLEFFPPIEIDFDARGNAVYIKQRDRKPDWIEYDVGLSRKRDAEP